MKFTKILLRVSQAVGLAVTIGVLFLAVGLVTDTWTARQWPRLYCQDLPWEVVVADYKATNHNAPSSGNCLMTLVGTVDQANDVIKLAESENDQKTVNVAMDRRAEIISRVFAEARTCDEVKQAWRTTRQGDRITLRQKDYNRAVVLCGWPRIVVE